VETATHELLNGQPDWSTNLQLIDAVNQNRGAAPIVLAALKKRLNHKKHSVGLSAVVLLESLVKNCPNFVPYVATQEFMDEFVHTLPRQVRDPHNKSLFSGLKDYTRDIGAVERYDKTLLCIQSWGQTWSMDSPAVQRDRRLLIFAETYRTLQRQGVHFPAPERDEMAPIVTPAASSRVSQQKAAEQRKQLEELERQERQRQRAPVRIVFTDSECRSAVEACDLLTEMLNESDPREDLRRNELVHQIVETLKPSTANIANRLHAEAHAPNLNEKLLGELLQANEICIEAAAFYSGLLAGTRQRKKSSSAAAPAPAPSQSHSRSSSSAAPSHSPQSSATPVAVSLPSPDVSSKSRPLPTEKPAEKKQIPLLQPPPESATPTRHRPSPSAVAALTNARALPAVPTASAAAAPPGDDRPLPPLPVGVAPFKGALDMDLLFSPPVAAAAPGGAPVAAVPDFLSQPIESPPHLQPQQQPHDIFASASHAPSHASMDQIDHVPMETSGETPGGPAPVPVYVQQQALLRRAEEKKRQLQQQQQQTGASSSAPRTANLSSFAIAPPPSAGASAALFPVSPLASASSAASSPPRMPPLIQQSANPAATPFDTPEPDEAINVAEPFSQLALRTQPTQQAQPKQQQQQQPDVSDDWDLFKY
jgi:hypothetical protein